MSLSTVNNIVVKLKDYQFLLVTGTKEEEHTEESQDSHGHNIVYKESKYGSITRRVKLPSTISKFSSSFFNGVLQIVCDKQDTTFKYKKREPLQSKVCLESTPVVTQDSTSIKQDWADIQ